MSGSNGASEDKQPSPLLPPVGNCSKNYGLIISSVKNKSIPPCLLRYAVVLEMSPKVFITETVLLYHFSNPKGPKRVGDAL